MRTAIVVGAGIAGLATAGALSRTGWTVTLLEREERLQQGKTALILWPNGVRALRSLGLAGGLDSVATPASPLGVRRSDGRWLLDPDRGWPSDEDQPVILHRESLHEALIAGLGDQVDIRTGVTIRGARPEGRRPAVTDGNVTYQADLVIAADGADSAIRRRLSPTSILVPEGCAAWQALIPWFRAPQLPADVPTRCETTAAGHSFGYLPVGTPGSPTGTSRSGIYWAATAPGACRPEPPESQLGLLRRWFAGWPAPTEALLAATAPEDLSQQAVAELKPLPESLVFSAGTGGYVLVGDAGHALARPLGQGACLALEDAATLRVALRSVQPGSGLLEALAAYSRMRRTRAAKVAGQTRRIRALLEGGEGWTGRAVDLATRRALPRLLDRASGLTCDWYPPKRS